MTHPDFWLAREPDADPDDLDVWAAHEHPEVRLAVAQNPRTRTPTAHALVDDPDDATACAALARGDATVEQLDEAAISERAALRAQAAGDARTSEALVNGVLARDPDVAVLRALLENPKSDGGTIDAVLSAVRSLSPRRQFAYKAQAGRHPGTRVSTLQQLALDKHPFVRDAALSELTRRGEPLAAAPQKARRRESAGRGR